MKGYTQRLRALLKSGVDVDYADQFGHTALHQAARAGFAEGAEMLIEAGSDVNHRNEAGVTPLMNAAWTPLGKVVKVLLDTPGIDVKARSHADLAAIHYAAQNGSPESIRLLAQHGCNVNVLTSEGDAPLHLAVANGQAKHITVLVEAGACKSLKNAAGHTALEQAEQRLHGTHGYPGEYLLWEIIIGFLKRPDRR